MDVHPRRGLFRNRQLSQCLAKLIGTRSRTVTAADTFQFGDHFIDRQVLDQSADALQIAVASSPESDLADDAVFYFQLDV